MDAVRLERLRRRMRNLDAALLGMVAERMELAREVGAVKRALGVPLRDFEVERHVLDRAEAGATGLGLDAELARALMRQLIEEACRIQESEHYTAYTGDAESVLVVGGRGRMGRWLARFLESQGHRVRIFDPAPPADDEPAAAPTLAAGLDGSTIAFVATPLHRIAEDLDAITDAGYRGVVCDVASLKEHLRPALDRARGRGVGVTSIHPMFGGGARTLSDRVICVCDCGVPAATERVVGLFRETAARLVPLSIERHDQIAAYVLGLSHFVNLAFAQALARSGVPRAELESVGSTTFRSQLETTRSVAGDDPDLYFAIQRLNRFSPRVWEELARAADELSRAVTTGDRDAFAAVMGTNRAWLAGAEEELESNSYGARP